MKKAEAQICYLRQIEIEMDPLPEKYDFVLFLNLHKRLFEDLYYFAGMIREVDITKGTIPFCYVQNINTEQLRIFSELEKWKYLTGLNIDAFSERITYFSSELNALHPFREGNGRTTRLFLGLLAQNAGYRIQYRECDVKELLSADIEAFNGNLIPLNNIYRQIIRKI